MHHDATFSGHLFLFRGRKANLIKIVYWDGTGLCLFTKRLEHGVFLWPSNVDPGGTLMLTSAQLSILIDGVDWRAPPGNGLTRNDIRARVRPRTRVPILLPFAGPFAVVLFPTC